MLCLVSHQKLLGGACGNMLYTSLPILTCCGDDAICSCCSRLLPNGSAVFFKAVAGVSLEHNPSYRSIIWAIVREQDGTIRILNSFIYL